MKKINRREFLKLAGAFSINLAVPRVNSLPRYFKNPLNRQNILVIVFDALSASHLPVYGYPRDTTPNLSRFLNKAIVYHNHYSGGNYTTPGTASLLTGTLPWTHRAIVHNDTVADGFVRKNIFHSFQDYHRMAYSHNILVNTQLRQFLVDIDEYTPRNLLFLEGDALVDRVFTSDEDIASVGWNRAMKQSESGYSYSLYLSK